jgi:hypothetical protein
MRNRPASENRAGEVTITVPGHYTLLEYPLKGGGFSKSSTVIMLRPVDWKDPNRRERGEERGRAG